MHLQSGSILQHFLNNHNRKPTRTELTENTTIIARANSKCMLSVKEALLILHKNPSINRQYETFTHTLKLHPHRKIRTPTASERNTTESSITTTSLALEPTVISDDNSIDHNSSITLHPTSPAIGQRIANLLRTARINTNSDNDHQSSTSPRRPRSSTRRLESAQTE